MWFPASCAVLAARVMPQGEPCWSPLCCVQIPQPGAGQHRGKGAWLSGQSKPSRLLPSQRSSAVSSIPAAAGWQRHGYASVSAAAACHRAAQGQLQQACKLRWLRAAHPRAALRHLQHQGGRPVAKQGISGCRCLNNPRTQAAEPEIKRGSMLLLTLPHASAQIWRVTFKVQETQVVCMPARV